MKPECIAAVRAAAGDRPVSDAKLRAIEDAITSTRRELARQDRQLPPAQRKWASLPEAQQIAEAVAAAMTMPPTQADGLSLVTPPTGYTQTNRATTRWQPMRPVCLQESDEL